MVTRQSELHRVLGLMANELPAPDWVALVDPQGLVVACVPERPAVPEERISAMTAALHSMAERVLEEVEGGGLRYASVAGSRRQQLIVVLSQDHILSIGLSPEVLPQVAFRPVSRWVPELMRTLKRRFV